MEEASLDGRPVEVDRDAARLVLPPLAERNELRVRARGRYRRTGVGLHRFVDPVDGAVYLHTQFEPFDAHRVYPCFDQPDVRLRLALSARAAEGWRVLSNDDPAERPDDGAAGWWRFPETWPLPPYLTCLVGGPLHLVRDEHRGVPLGLACRASMVEHLEVDELFGITRAGLDFFEEAFATAYPFGPYVQAFVPEFNFGAMEHPGCVTFTERLLFRSRVTDAARMRRADVVLHEMAHMWFGNLVTMRWWDELWLNESFATLAASLATAEATRFGRHAWAEMAGGLKAWATRQDQLPSTHPIVADVVDTDAARLQFDGITYAKGAATLRQLMAFVGREAFLDGCARYFARHRWGSTTLDDFLAALSEAAGRDLSAWADAWLRTSGVNTLRPQMTASADDPARLQRLEVRQQPDASAGLLRPHRIAVGGYRTGPDGRLHRSLRAEVELADEVAEVPDVAGTELPELVVANDDDLTYAKLRLDERSLATLRDRLAAVDDPLTRTVCWGALWDMARDAELPARAHLEVVLAHAGHEPPGTLATLHQQALAGLERYCDPDARASAAADASARAWRLADRCSPGSDDQLAWTRLAARLATDRDQLDRVERLLDGDDVPEGLAVDTDLRWLLVIELAASGRLGEEGIEAERRRDPTDFGERSAAAAAAARPTPGAKRAAADRVLDDADLPLQTLRAITGALHRAGHEPALEPLRDRWAAALTDVWRGRAPEVAESITEGLYPHALVDPATLHLAEQVLDGDLPDQARRIVAECRDGTERALRARRADRAADGPPPG